MKRWIHAASDAQVNSVKKYVRTLIYTVWTEDPENPSDMLLFSDPNMFCNMLVTEYIKLQPKESFPLWIYNRRDELFKDFVYTNLENSKYSSEVINIGKDYFDNLTLADYNRNLHLPSYVKHYISKGITPTEYFAKPFNSR